MGAEKGPEGFRDGAGEEKVRPGALSLQVVRKPLLGCLRLALGTGPVATGMVDPVLLATAVALREAMAIASAVAVLDSAAALAVRGRQRGRALKVRGGKGGEDSAAGGHGRHPGMRELRRA